MLSTIHGNVSGKGGMEESLPLASKAGSMLGSHPCVRAVLSVFQFSQRRYEELSRDADPIPSFEPSYCVVKNWDSMPGRIILPNMEPFTHLGCPIPSIIWDTLEHALQVNMERLAKDVAKCLEQPEQPLLAALKATKVKPYIVELTNDRRDSDICCDYICQRGDSPHLLQPCGQPVFWGATHVSRCPQHMYSVPRKLPTLPVLKALSPIEDEPPLYVAEDGTIYNDEYKARGQLTDGKIILYEVAE